MIGETPIFHLHNLESPSWNFSRGGLFEKKILTSEVKPLCEGCFFGGGGQRWKEWNKKHLLPKGPWRCAHIRFWKVENCEGGATSGLPPHERETGNLFFFYTHSMYPCHVISKTTSFFFGGQEFRTTGGSLPCGGLATAFKIHPGQKITASWSLQIGQGPTGNDMVFKPSILKCKLAVCFREGNTNDLLFKDSLHIANIFCQLGNVWNFEYLIFFTSMSYQHNV